MDLFYRELGQGKPLFILHGLYGSLENWLTLGKKFAEKNKVFLVDQRNHGNSPHSKEHTFELMVEDLKSLFDKLLISKAILLGHSMGGKTVMQFALTHPELVERLIVVDISPKSYYDAEKDSEQNRIHASIIEALASLPINEITSREEADERLAVKIKLKAVRQFLLKNLGRNKDNGFEWKLNVRALKENMALIFGGFENEFSTNRTEMENIKTLFIRGGKSNYMVDSDKELIDKYFPNLEIEIIEDAGHWVHAEQPEKFSEIVDAFIS